MKRTVRLKAQFDVEVEINEDLMEMGGLEVANQVDAIPAERLKEIVVAGIGNNTDVLDDQIEKIKGEFQIGI